MLNPNAGVWTVRSVEPDVAVELDGERRVPLDPDDRRSAGFAQVLEGLRELGRPVYFELNPDTGTIDRLLIPLVSPVVGLSPLKDGVLRIELANSHTVHKLWRNAPDFEELERELRAALDTGEPVILVEDDISHDVIDVRRYQPDPEAPPGPFLRPQLPQPSLRDRWWLRIWNWRWWPWWWWFWWFRCLSPARAQQVFDAMNATSCDPLTTPAPCIPFRYPDDGCWARAHEMCRLMIAMQLGPKKVWIRQGPGSVLHVNTRNSPSCFVEWWYHVAPTLCVRGPWFSTERMVIDPSMFTTPVTEATWKAAANDPSATLTDTDASQYGPNGGTDPTYASTNADLATYRLALQNRSTQSGPPPYANCP